MKASYALEHGLPEMLLGNTELPVQKQLSTVLHFAGPFSTAGFQHACRNDPSFPGKLQTVHHLQLHMVLLNEVHDQS